MDSGRVFVTAELDAGYGSYRANILIFCTFKNEANSDRFFLTICSPCFADRLIFGWVNHEWFAKADAVSSSSQTIQYAFITLEALLTFDIIFAIFQSPSQRISPSPTGSGWRSIRWFFWKLSTMPNCNNPNDIFFNPIKKPIRGYDHLPVVKIRKLGYDSTAFRQILKPS